VQTAAQADPPIPAISANAELVVSRVARN